MKNKTLHLFVFKVLRIALVFGLLIAVAISCSSADDEDADSVIYRNLDKLSPTASTDKVLSEYLNAEQASKLGDDMSATRTLVFKVDGTFVCTSYYTFTFNDTPSSIEAVYTGNYSGGIERTTQKGSVKVFGRSMDFTFDTGTFNCHTIATLNEDGVDLVITKLAASMTIKDPISQSSDAILSRELAFDEEDVE